MTMTLTKAQVTGINRKLSEAAHAVAQCGDAAEEINLIAVQALDYDTPSERHIEALRKIAEMTALEAE